MINTSGTGEADTYYLGVGTTATYTITVNNIGPVAETYLLTSGPGKANWTTLFTAQGADITSTMQGNGWTTPSIAAGASLTVTLTMTPSAAAPVNDKYTLLVLATSTGDAAKADAVQAVTILSN